MTLSIWYCILSFTLFCREFGKVDNYALFWVKLFNIKSWWYKTNVMKIYLCQIYISFHDLGNLFLPLCNVSIEEKEWWEQKNGAAKHLENVFLWKTLPQKASTEPHLLLSHSNTLCCRGFFTNRVVIHSLINLFRPSSFSYPAFTVPPRLYPNQL